MNDEFKITRLGDCQFDSPLDNALIIEDNAGVVLDATVQDVDKVPENPTYLELAGPRKKIFFNPKDVNAAIVTCGGLCPGLNDVIRGLVMVLRHRYGVRNVLGIPYGYEGMIPSYGHELINLTPDVVKGIHNDGGTILGSSRGPQPVPEQVDFLVDNGITILFTIGGDGTQRGARDIADEVKKRNLGISVIGVPKTIDNDVAYTDRTFGFETAVAMSQPPIKAAHDEAKGAYNGIGIVKLMGRESGFVAANAALASSDVNLLLVPEVSFTLEQVMSFLEKRFQSKKHVVILVAEGAGQELMDTDGTDKSGNKKLGDIGVFLKARIAEHFKAKDFPVSIKYIDPSYTIRSAPATPDDSVFCFQLAGNAAHAAMSGRTDMVVGLWNNHFVHVPLDKAVSKRKQIEPNGMLWQTILDNTGQVL